MRQTRFGPRVFFAGPKRERKEEGGLTRVGPPSPGVPRAVPSELISGPRRAAEGPLRQRLLPGLMIAQLRREASGALAELCCRDAVPDAVREALHFVEDLAVLPDQLVHLLGHAPVGEDAEDALVPLLPLEVLGQERREVLEGGQQ